MKLISFLVTTYNLEEWMLKRCIDSLIDQNISPSAYEIIVVDDGSQQSPEPWLQCYTDAPIRFHRQPNGGPGAARNTAIGLAEGKYLMFVDGDDYLFLSTLSPLLKLLEQEQPDILQFDFRRCSQREPEQITTMPLQTDTFESGAHYMLRNNLTGANCIYIFHRAIIEQNQLAYKERIFHEDEEFITRLFFFARKVMVTNQLVYAYYYREGSIVRGKTTEHVMKRFEDFVHVVESLNRFAVEQQASASPIQQQALQRKLSYLGIDFIIKTLREKQTEQYLSAYLPRLKQIGLYPIPSQPQEGLRYQLFRLLAHYPLGRAILKQIDRQRNKKFE